VTRAPRSDRSCAVIAALLRFSRSQRALSASDFLFVQGNRSSGLYSPNLVSILHNPQRNHIDERQLNARLMNGS
jgi:hypothetical protein